MFKREELAEAIKSRLDTCKTMGMDSDNSAYFLAMYVEGLVDLALRVDAFAKYLHERANITMYECALHVDQIKKGEAESLPASVQKIWQDYLMKR